MQKMTFTEAITLIRSGAPYRMFDVREEDEYLLGHAQQADSFPLSTIAPDTAATLIPSLTTPIIVYCKTGLRSHAAAEELDLLGYTHVYDLGGLAGWPYGIEHT